ncbi:MAG: LytTR family transcriptional regulator DNA-binding domain-containing protein [Spirosomaceae bacterium]|jgi:two-component system LytT family response regulator|nr:LytTR family transcriptional regulator DNA-binding domain-containing protein [Spirosomataceae bacterium]
MNQLQIMGKRVHRQLNTSEIIRINGNINYSEIFTNSGKKFVIAKTLKKYEENLELPFFRGSKSCIINLNFLKSINSDGTIIYLKDGYELPISRRRRGKLLEILNELYVS